MFRSIFSNRRNVNTLKTSDRAARPPAHASGRCVPEVLESRRLFAAGDLDTTFGGGDGVVTLDVTGSFSDVVALPGDKLLAVGRAESTAGNGDMYLARFNPDGSFDSTFGGGDGQVFADFGTSFDGAARVGVRPDGKLVVYGNVLARFNANGSLDTTFGGGDGFTTLEPGTPFNQARQGLTLQADNRIVIARDDAVYRYTADGALDTTFGNAGKFRPADITRPDGTPVFDTFRAADVAVQPGGKLVVAGDGFIHESEGGSEYGHSDDFIVLRLTASGQLDRTFADGDEGGDFFAWEDADVDDTVNRMSVGPDGRVAIVGGEGDEDAHHIFVDPDGDNIVLSTLNWGYGEANDIAFDSKGRTPSAGYQRIRSNDEFDAKAVRAARDSTFAGPGGPLTNLKVGDDDEARGLAVAADDDVVAVGYVVYNRSTAASHPFILRYEGETESTEPAVTVQAENARVVGAHVARDNPGYTGTGYVDFAHATGDSVEWSFSAGSAGTRRLEIRYANGSSSPRALQISVNGRVVSSRLEFAPTGGWRTWKTVSLDVPAVAGSNTVRLATNGVHGPNVDSFTVRTTSVTPPTLTLQAEDAIRSNVRVSTSNPGYTGAGYADYSDMEGSYINWNFLNPSAGRRTLSFRYANGGASDRPLELRVNGRVIDPAMSFVSTGSWGTWRVITVTVDLVAGNNSVRLTSGVKPGPNFDWLTVQ